MERLRLDFNNRDPHDWVKINPVSFARNAPLRELRVGPGDRVLVEDYDGNSAEGVLREDPEMPEGHRLRVEMDWSTWQDGEAEVAALRHYSAAAP